MFRHVPTCVSPLLPAGVEAVAAELRRARLCREAFHKEALFPAALLQGGAGCCRRACRLLQRTQAVRCHVADCHACSAEATRA